MTLAVGRRVIIVEGVERWRDADVKQHLSPALERIAPETTLGLFAREDARAKAPQALHSAVERAGGQVVAHATVKPWELPRWVREQAARLGLALDAAAAGALVDQVGERQQRLLRELEKLALEGAESGAPGVPRAVSAAEIEARAADSAERRAFELADALVADNRRQAMRSYVRLREQGERPAGLVYTIASRLRDAVAVAARLAEGTPVAEIRRGLRGPAKAKARFVADVAASEPQRITGAFAALADLELDSRGGAPVQASRTSVAGLDEDTLAVRAIEEISR
jgi:DNA polymerase-3 subunit delta